MIIWEKIKIGYEVIQKTYERINCTLIFYWKNIILNIKKKKKKKKKKKQTALDCMVNRCFIRARTSDEIFFPSRKYKLQID